jgi:hypothetical protein
MGYQMARANSGTITASGLLMMVDDGDDSADEKTH